MQKFIGQLTQIDAFLCRSKVQKKTLGKPQCRTSIHLPKLLSQCALVISPVVPLLISDSGIYLPKEVVLHFTAEWVNCVGVLSEDTKNPGKAKLASVNTPHKWTFSWR